MKRIALYSLLLVLGSTSCKNPFEPGQTIFGDPILHHVVVFNRSDFNVEVVISATPTLTPADDWQDVPRQYQGSVGRASWDIQEGVWYVFCRFKATGQVYYNAKKVILDSNPENRVFEGHSVGAVINATPGQWGFARKGGE